jgi:glycosyltransferase involved in cell wall biosynthesis
METLNRQRCQTLETRNITCHLLYFFPGEGIKNIVDIPTFITNSDQEMKAVIKKEKYDVIVVCSDFYTLKKIRKYGFKGKLIFELQGLGTIDNAHKTLQHAKHYVIKYADAILIPETAHLKELVRLYFPYKRTFHFHNCIDTAAFSYRPLPKLANPAVGWVGRIEENKNWRGFLQFAHELIKHKSDVQLWMFKDAALSSHSERKVFQSLVQQLNLSDRLKTYSNVPHKQMADYYSRISDSGGFLCSTSDTEGFGYAIVEAMCCNCPVLTTDSDGVKNFIIHNKTGKFFSFNNLSGGVQEAVDLIDNKGIRQRIIEQALEHIKINFNPQQYAENFIMMLRSL